MATPISMRLPEDDIAIIDRAARMRGRSRTDFVREAAVQAAEAVILEQSTIRMSAKDFAAFRASIEAPAHPVARMVNLLRETPPWSET